MSNLLFFLFSGLALLASLFVVFSSNPVHSVLSLILVFCATAMLVLLLRVDFLAILLVVVYVGAIAVLFLFVVMMLSIKLVQLSESVLRWIPIGVMLVISMVSQVFYVFWGTIGDYSEDFDLQLGSSQLLTGFESSWFDHLHGVESLGILGSVLYSFFFYSFLLSSFVLFVSLVGAITLTVGSRRMSRRQHIYKQVGREAFGSIKFYK